MSLNQTLASQIKIKMSNVTAIAEKGPNSYVVLAALETEGGPLVYTVWVADSGFNFHRVQIDPANGKVLSSRPLTIAMRQLALFEMQRGMISSGSNPGQGRMMSPGQVGPDQGGISPGQAGSGQGGMMGKP